MVLTKIETYQENSINTTHSPCIDDFDIAENHAQKGQWREALESFQKVISYTSEHWLAQHRIGDMFLALNRWQDAISSYQKVLAIRCDYEWTWHNLSVAMRKVGQWKEAINCCQALTNLKPDFWEQHPQDQSVQLQWMWFQIHLDQQQGNWLQALNGYQVLLEENPEVWDFIDFQALLGWLRSGKDSWQEVLNYSQKVNSKEISEVNVALNKFTKSTVELLAVLEHTPRVNHLVLPHSHEPLVSVIIPVYNKIDYTYRCLESLVKNIDCSTHVEIIVVNDCSSDETQSVLEEIEGLVLVNNEINSGFIRTCNAGAAASKGKYLYFLNNDTEISTGCIEELVKVLDSDEQVGAVGSKLVYPNGALQESGGIIWNDASGWNYGRMQNPFAPEYNYLRPVDYCSAASLLVRRNAFELLGGFSETYLPAYYEDTDLCFGIRNVLNLKVLCQPKSEVVHYEGISSGTSTDSGVKRYQIINSEKFKNKWTSFLENHLQNLGIDNVPTAARRYLGTKTVLIINPYPPCYDKESGARRIFEIIKLLKSLKYHVIFAPHNGYKEEPYVTELQNCQVEVLYTQAGFGTDIAEQIEARLSIIDYAWICFPDMVKNYLSLIRKNPDIKIIYDTIDLHFIRLKRAWKLENEPRDTELEKEWLEMQNMEISLANQTDMTLTVTPIEREILQSQGIPNVKVVPNIHISYGGEITSFNERQGLLFIGGYKHPPNIDAVLWLCNQIMPLIWEKMPDLKVTLLGSNPTDEVQELASKYEQVLVPGYVKDITSYFLESRIFVAPLQYGAGMKGKIGQSLEYGLPIISTDVGAEGMNLRPNESVLIANTVSEFSINIQNLYKDESLWNKLSKNSDSALKQFSPSYTKNILKGLLDSLR